MTDNLRETSAKNLQKNLRKTCSCYEEQIKTFPEKKTLKVRSSMRLL